MTTYRKAWLFNAFWVLCLIIPLAIIGWHAFSEAKALGDKNATDSGHTIAVIGLFLTFFVIGHVADRFPKCPHCAEPVNMADVREPSGRWWSSGGPIPVMRPQRPPRTCGYCGLDLTVPYNPE